MDGIWDYLRDSNASPYVVLLVFCFYILADKTNFFKRKSEREQLSQDQAEFRKSMMDDMAGLRREIHASHVAHMECEDRYSKACHKINEIIEAIQSGHLDMLMNLAKIKSDPDLRLEPPTIGTSHEHCE